MKCPVCGSIKKHQTFGDYMKCQECLCLFLPKPPDTKKLKTQVDTDANVMLSSESENTTPHLARLEALSKFIKKGKLLDVGCGYGTFLLCAKEQGYKAYAMDLSKKLVDHMKKKGIEGYTDMHMIAKQSFEIVTAFDVIEHTTQPHELVQQMKRVLKKNGIIMLTTPNFMGISGTILGKKWWALGPDAHYTVFSPKSLRHILEANGFEIISEKTDTFTQWFPANNTLPKKVANKLLYLLSSPFQTSAYKNLLGDNLEIIGRLK